MALDLPVTWNAVEARLKVLAESGERLSPDDIAEDRVLLQLGVFEEGVLSERGDAYYMARFVRNDPEESAKALADVLKRRPEVNAFLSRLWGVGDVPVDGAVSLVRRVFGVDDDRIAKRWLEVMTRADLISFNRRNPNLRVLYNPDELLSPDEQAMRERDKAHVLAPDAAYGNRLALRELIRSARGHIYWYEQHMEAKVMEVLYREVEAGNVEEIRLLSGPVKVNDELKSDYKQFKKEIKARRNIKAEWRILPAKQAQKIHARLFFSRELARRLPPLNLILQGTTDEIAPTDIGEDEFQKWWGEGQDLSSYTLTETNG